MKRSIISIFLFICLSTFSYANTKVPATDITSTTNTFSKCLTSVDNNVQQALNDIDACFGTGGSSGFQESFTNSSLSSGILTVNHNLNSQFSIVQVSDNNNTIMLPDTVTLTNSNTAMIDLSSQGTISGTWNVSILPVNSTTPTYSYMLLESSGYLLLENGGKLIL